MKPYRKNSKKRDQRVDIQGTETVKLNSALQSYGFFSERQQDNMLKSHFVLYGLKGTKHCRYDTEETDKPASSVFPSRRQMTFCSDAPYSSKSSSLMVTPISKGAVICSKRREGHKAGVGGVGGGVTGY